MSADPIKLKPQPRSEENPTGSLQGASGPQPVETQPAPPPQRSLARLNRLQASAGLLIAALVTITACYVAKLILVVLLVSILLAFILAPLVDLFARIRLPRSVGALIAVILLLAAIGALGYVSLNKATDFIQDLPRYTGQVRGIVSKMRQRTEKIQQATDKVTGQNPKSTRNQKQQSGSAGLNWSSLITDNVGSVTEVVFAASFVPFLIYFMLSWQEHVRSATVKLFRMENRNTAYVTMGLISTMIRSYIVGNVLVGLFIGGISTIVFGILHLPYFYFIGFISGFLNLVPYLGVVLAPIAPLLAGVGHIHSTQVIVIIVTEVVLHLFSLNVLYPKFLGSRLQLNPLAVTLSLLFWGWLWGAMGLILAIPITAGAKIIFDHIESLRPMGEWLGE